MHGVSYLCRSNSRSLPPLGWLAICAIARSSNKLLFIIIRVANVFFSRLTYVAYEGKRFLTAGTWFSWGQQSLFVCGRMSLALVKRHLMEIVSFV